MSGKENGKKDSDKKITSRCEQDPDNDIMKKLPSGSPLASTSFGKCLDNILNTLSSRDPMTHSYDHLVKLREALIRDEQFRRMFDFTLSKSMGIENLLMEEKIKNLSNFVIKSSFDMGLNKYYTHIAHQVDSSLRSRGLGIDQNPALIKEKQRWLRRKQELNRQKQLGEKMRSPKHKRQGSDQSQMNASGVSLPCIHRDPSNFNFKMMNLRYKRKKSIAQESSKSPRHHPMFILDDL